jgi:acyl-CoA synthetase (AMP-forming)/AMP-acid ligase II
MSYPAYVDGKIHQEVFPITCDLYPDVDYQLNGAITDDTVCCVTHTSGTTGEPKIVKTTHKVAIELVQENIKLFEFRATDRVLHHKTLHHGSLFLNYAIPAFVTTNQHYWTIQKTSETVIGFMEKCLDLCVTGKISKWLTPYRFITELGNPNIKSYNISSTSLITAVGPSQHEMKLIFDKQHPDAVYNNFGCTELGTLAISKTQLNNIAEYAPNRFTKLNGLIDWEIFPDFFKAKFKNDHEWRTIGDIVKFSNDVFFWEGRNSCLTFDQQKIKVSAIDKWTREWLNTSAFSLVPDFEVNALYIAVFDTTLDLTLNDLNQALKSTAEFKNCVFSKMAQIEFKDVVQGIKPSQPVLLHYFRGLPVEIV